MTALTARPSGSAVWLACPMGLTMQNRYGNRYPAGVAAEEGTAAHEVLERSIHVGGYFGDVGTPASNGVAITEDMKRHANEAIEFVNELAMGGEVLSEKRLVLKLPNTPDIVGTGDVVVRPPDGKTVHVIDYKYGHTHVPADSPQLKIYGIAAAQEFNRERVMLHVIQPRDYTAKPVRSYHFTPAEQNAFCAQVEVAMRLAASRQPVAIPGSHCSRCPGRGQCAAVRDWSMVEEHAGSDAQLTPEAVAAELHLARRQAELAAARVKGLEDEAAHVLRAGGVVPGWALERKPGRQQWKASDEAHVLALADAFGVGDTVSKRVLITPMQAQKAGLPAELVKLHTERPVGEPKLVPAADTLAAKTFGA